MLQFEGIFDVLAERLVYTRWLCLALLRRTY